VTAELGAWPFLLLAIAATYLWRGLGVLFSTRIDPEGALFQWVICVSYAMLAGLISRMIVMPLGILAEIPLIDRLAAVAMAFLVFFGGRRSVLPGVAAGTVVLVLLVLARENGWFGG
jgi:branched-subunit amino acid transport protein